MEGANTSNDTDAKKMTGNKMNDKTIISITALLRICNYNLYTITRFTYTTVLDITVIY